MKLYRICPEVYLENYDGLGASYSDGGRWNSPGKPVIYYACSPATALLELANYLPSPRLVPKSYRLGVFKLPPGAPLEDLADNKWPEDWAQYPYPTTTQAIGDRWLASKKALVLRVPSAAVPGGLDKIALVNPLHSRCKEIKLQYSLTDIFNKRAFSGVR